VRQRGWTDIVLYDPARHWDHFPLALGAPKGVRPIPHRSGTRFEAQRWERDDTSMHLRHTETETFMAKNLAKYLSYREAWRRIKAATEGGFYFEVVTLCESIISDRLLSYILGTNAKSKASLKTSFADLIKEWRLLAKGALQQQDGSDLGATVDEWRIERNAIVHSLTKSAPGTPTPPVLTFIERAKKAAGDGDLLAAAVQKWHKRQQAGHRGDGRMMPRERHADRPNAKQGC